MAKVVRIVHGMVFEGDTSEEVDKKVEEFLKEREVSQPADPFQTASPAPSSPIRIVGTNVRPEERKEDAIDLSGGPEIVLPEEGAIDEQEELDEGSPEFSRVEDEVMDSDLNGEEDGSSSPTGEETEGAEEEKEVEGEDDGDYVEIPDDLSKLTKKELVSLAKELGLDSTGSKKELISRIQEVIDRETRDGETA